MNADPRRPEKVQRYPQKSAGSGDDLTPDYMNLMGQHATTANVASEPQKTSTATEVKGQDGHLMTEEPVITTNATSVIPTSPQYGVAIINPVGGTVSSDLPTEVTTQPTEKLSEVTAKPVEENKDLHSTPSRNDRFKVVKIASLEPFKRGRWKCMDYVDEAPPAGVQSKIAQSGSNIQVPAGVYLQTQSLPQQQIQQMLMQSGFANGTQFFPNMQAQMIPQTQYFYPQVSGMQNQNISQVPSSMPTQFINNQQYFPVPNAGGFTMPQNYPNVQYVPTNMMQNQSGTFVPTSQNVQVQNFQQSQTYAGQPNISQSNIVQQQPMVNGHSFPPPNDQATASSLPTQAAKTVIINTNNPQTNVNQSQIMQQNLQSQMNIQNQTQQIPILPNPQYQQNQQFQGQLQTQQAQSLTQPTNVVPIVQPAVVLPPAQVVSAQSQNIEQNLANNVYTNPQFAMSVNSLTVLENSEQTNNVNDVNSAVETVSESTDDPAKTNPVVNAIDNKIEQAMDLVKSHLMYTVREEVEVLKEKIAELMERIQQLETENNFLRSQIPKNQNSTPATSASLVNPVTSQGTVNPSPSMVPPPTNQPISTNSHINAAVSSPCVNSVPTNQSAQATVRDASSQQ